MNKGCKNAVCIKTGLHMLLWLMLCLPLAGCAQDESGGNNMATARISPYNHTSDHIGQIYVDGVYASNSYAYGGGGSFVCCIGYPRQWREGLSASVRWSTSSSNPEDPRVLTWHEKVVPIERYEKTGTTLNVHFLPEGEVRLIITDLSAWHPDYPGPDAPEKPADWPW